MLVIKDGNVTTTNERAYILSRWELAATSPEYLARDNDGAGTPTVFGAVKGGTPMAKITSGTHINKHRPAGDGAIDGDQGPTATLQMEANQADLFFGGDVVEIISPLGRLGIAQLTNLTAAGDDIDLTSVVAEAFAHVVNLVDPAALKDSTDITKITWAGTPGASIATIEVTLRSSVAPTILATADELAAVLNTTGIVYAVVAGTGTNVINDAGVTATLSDGIAAGGQVDASEIVVSVDKTLHRVVVTDPQTVKDGDRVRVLNAPTTSGIAQNAMMTSQRRFDADGEAIHADQDFTLISGGWVKIDESAIPELSTFHKADLQSNGLNFTFE